MIDEPNDFPQDRPEAPRSAPPDYDPPRAEDVETDERFAAWPAITSA